MMHVASGRVRRKTVSLGFQHVSYQKVINAIFICQNGMVTECLSIFLLTCTCESDKINV